MSAVLNAIIARGFDSPIQGAMNSYNNQRQANQSQAINETNLAGAQQNQEFARQDQAAQVQDRQSAAAQQQELNDLYGVVEQLATMDQSDPQVHEAIRAVAARLESRKSGAGTAMQSIFNPKAPNQGRPVAVMTPNGPQYVAAQDAVGQTPYDKPPSFVVQPSIDQKAAEAGAVEAARLGAQSAADAGKAKVAAAAQAKAAEKAYATYRVAMGNVAKTFEETDTGPIVGQLPAYTTDQQKAVGAVAAVTPILKQIFRSAGEGVFTDKDQELLTDMAPKRTDRKEVAQAKIQSINEIVASKLGVTAGTQPAQPKSYTSKGGAKVEILGN